MNDNWGGSDFAPIPDDFWNDSANFNTPDLDNIVWGSTDFDDVDDRIFDAITDVANEEGFDALADIIGRYASDEDETDEDDYGDDLDPITERESLNWWEDAEYEDVDDLGYAGVVVVDDLPKSAWWKDVRGPFLTLLDLQLYFDSWGGKNLIDVIYFSRFSEAFYAVVLEESP